MFPGPFLATGLVFYQFLQKKIFKTIVVAISGVLLFTFINNGFFKSAPNRIIDQTSQIADLVLEKTNGEPYNFALISESNSDHAYRYFLEVRNRPPTALETEITNQLLVICESKKCEPLGHPLWEIAAFGRAQIEEEWNLEKLAAIKI